MPRKAITDDEVPAVEVVSETETPYAEPVASEPLVAEVVTATDPPPEARIVKLAHKPDMWLIEDDIARPITSSKAAALLFLPVEVVDGETLEQWPIGETYP